MMADHFIDDEAQEFFSKIGIEVCVLGEFTQTRDLPFFATRISGRKPRLRLVAAHCLRHLKPLGEHKHQCGINVVDTFPIMLQLRIGHAGLPSLHLP